MFDQILIVLCILVVVPPIILGLDKLSHFLADWEVGRARQKQYNKNHKGH